MVHRKGLGRRGAAHRRTGAGALLLRAVLARVSHLAAAFAAAYALHGCAYCTVYRAVCAAGRGAGAAAPPLRTAGRRVVCRQPVGGECMVCLLYTSGIHRDQLPAEKEATL